MCVNPVVYYYYPLFEEVVRCGRSAGLLLIKTFKALFILALSYCIPPH